MACLPQFDMKGEWSVLHYNVKGEWSVACLPQFNMKGEWSVFARRGMHLWGFRVCKVYWEEFVY